MDLLSANDRPGTYPPSWYAATAPALAPFAPLRGRVEADVCIVGAGYTGLSAALACRAAGLEVVVLEAQRVGFGASGRNGGQVGSGQRVAQRALSAQVGAARAAALWQLGEAAKARVAQLIATHQIDAGYRPGVAHVVRHDASMPEVRAEAAHLSDSLGYQQIEVLDREALHALVPAAGFAGGTVDWGAGHLHPLRFALGLAEAASAAGATLHERTRAHRVEPGSAPVVRTDRGSVTARHVILAGNGYLAGLDRRYAARVMPINNFMVATAPLGERAKTVTTRDIAVADDRFVVNYWRLSEDGRLLFGGGESYGYRFPRDIAALVRPRILGLYPALHDVPVEFAWGGTLAITLSRLPFLEQTSPGLWAAGGYSGQGVALSVLAGELIAEAITGDTARFETMRGLATQAFPGGGLGRAPLLALAMSWYALRDRLGM